MSAQTPTPDRGPDLTQGVSVHTLTDNVPFAGHVGGKDVLLIRQGGSIFALGAHCTHYGAPLRQGIVARQTIRCPWHHAAFRLHDGGAETPPALAPVACYEVEKRGDNVFVNGSVKKPVHKKLSSDVTHEHVLIVGGGAAGDSAAAALRQEGYSKRITVIADEARVFYDRPPLSKDFLASGTDPNAIALRPANFYRDNEINLQVGTRVTSLAPQEQTCTLADGKTVTFDRIILATGATPVRPNIPGSDLPHVHTLRSLEDARKLQTVAAPKGRAVLVGAGFIGLEAAAALTKRGLSVHVVAPQAVPLERVMGRDMGLYIQRLHASRGVVFHLDNSVLAIEKSHVVLKDGSRLQADVVLLGVGVKPNTELASAAGLHVDNGVVCNPYLRTSHPNVYAAGDIVSFIDPVGGERVRIEHWATAQKQGQIAARNVLAKHERYNTIPFFWTRHYETSVAYVGHAEHPERTQVFGNVAEGKGAVAFFTHGTITAVATVGLPQVSLQCERGLEENDTALVKRALATIA